MKIDGKTVGDQKTLLDVWIKLFGNLAKSQAGSCPGLQVYQNCVDILTSVLLRNEEYLLDIPFSVDEVEHATRRLKKRKTPGPDNLLAEHLLEGGDIIVAWMTGILNAVVDLECVPDVAIITPVYKGEEKEPPF